MLGFDGNSNVITTKEFNDLLNKPSADLTPQDKSQMATYVVSMHNDSEWWKALGFDGKPRSEDAKKRAEGLRSIFQAAGLQHLDEKLKKRYDYATRIMQTVLNHGGKSRVLSPEQKYVNTTAKTLKDEAKKTNKNKKKVADDIIKHFRSTTLNIIHVWQGKDSITQETLLHLAIKLGYPEMVNQLITWKADVTSPSNCGNTTLHLAAAQDNFQLVEFLANGRKEGKLDVNAVNDWGQTPLHMAAFYGHFDVVDLLIRCGAKADIVDQKGKTAAQYATERKDTVGQDIAHYLKDPVKRFVLSVNYSNGESSYISNISMGWLRIELKKQTPEGESTAKAMLESTEIKPAYKQVVFDSALVTTSAQRSNELVKWLLEQGANPAANNGLAIYSAFTTHQEDASDKTLDLFVNEQGERPKAWLDAALVGASIYGNQAALEKLVAMGANLDEKIDDVIRAAMHPPVTKAKNDLLLKYLWPHLNRIKKADASSIMLFHAVECGRPDFVEGSCKAQAQVTYSDALPVRTVLTQLSKNSNDENAKKIFEILSNSTGGEEALKTALVKLVDQKKYNEAFYIIISKKIDIKEKAALHTLLIEAIEKKQPRVVTSLLRLSYADLHTKDYEAVKLLANKLTQKPKSKRLKAILETFKTAKKEEFECALTHAIATNNPDLLEFLRKNGVAFNEKDEWYQKDLPRQALCSLIESNKGKPQESAEYQSYQKVLSLLSQDDLGQGQIFKALRQATYKSLVEVVRILLNTKVTFTVEQMSGIIIDAANGDYNAATLLQIFKEHENGQEALNFALINSVCVYGKKTIKNLLDAGADITFQNGGVMLELGKDVGKKLIDSNNEVLQLIKAHKDAEAALKLALNDLVKQDCSDFTLNRPQLIGLLKLQDIIQDKEQYIFGLYQGLDTTASAKNLIMDATPYLPDMIKAQAEQLASEKEKERIAALPAEFANTMKNIAAMQKGPARDAELRKAVSDLRSELFTQIPEKDAIVIKMLDVEITDAELKKELFNKALIPASENERMEVVKWLLEKEAQPDYIVIANIANCNAELLQTLFIQLKDKKQDLFEKAMYNAIRSDKVEAVTNLAATCYDNKPTADFIVAAAKRYWGKKVKTLDALIAPLQDKKKALTAALDKAILDTDLMTVKCLLEYDELKGIDLPALYDKAIDENVKNGIFNLLTPEKKQAIKLQAKIAEFVQKVNAAANSSGALPGWENEFFNKYSKNSADNTLAMLQDKNISEAAKPMLFTAALIEAHSKEFTAIANWLLQPEQAKYLDKVKVHLNVQEKLRKRIETTMSPDELKTAQEAKEIQYFVKEANDAIPNPLLHYNDAGLNKDDQELNLYSPLSHLSTELEKKTPESDDLVLKMLRANGIYDQVKPKLLEGALVKAAKAGRVNVVTALLTEFKVAPECDNNAAIFAAAQACQQDIIAQLLSHNSVKNSVDYVKLYGTVQYQPFGSSSYSPQEVKEFIKLKALRIEAIQLYDRTLAFFNNISLAQFGWSIYNEHSQNLLNDAVKLLDAEYEADALTMLQYDKIQALDAEIKHKLFELAHTWASDKHYNNVTAWLAEQIKTLKPATANIGAGGKGPGSSAVDPHSKQNNGNNQGKGEQVDTESNNIGNGKPPADHIKKPKAAGTTTTQSGAKHDDTAWQGAAIGGGAALTVSVVLICLEYHGKTALATTYLPQLIVANQTTLVGSVAVATTVFVAIGTIIGAAVQSSITI